MNSAFTILVVGGIVFLSHWFHGIFEKKGIPDVLLLMLVGLLFGPILGVIHADDFGIAGPMFTSITLVVILFEGGLGLNLNELKSSIRGSTSLTLINFFATFIIVGVISYFLLGLDLLVALTLGAILGGTSSAVVIPMVRLLKIREESRTILVLESAVSDVLCIVFALALIEATKSGNLQVGLIVGKILSSFTFAAIIGIAGAIVWSILLNRIRTIQNSIFTTPAFVFVVYGVAEILGYSGAISALLFGITLVNIKQFNFSFLKKYVSSEPIALNDTERVFFSEIVFLLKTFFFVYIGLSIRLDSFTALLFGLVLAIAMFVLRIPVVRFSIKSQLPIFDKTVMAAMVPKGLAAAVLAGIPMQQGIVGGELVRNVTYAVVLISIVFTSVLIPLFSYNERFGAVYGWLLRFRLISVKNKPHKVDDTVH
ncbi:MAG: cation:proton antiporter [Bacteroidales bacterium]